MAPGFFADFSNDESTTFSETTLRQLQDRQAQECGACDLQKPAPQTETRLNRILRLLQMP
jgi:hypothetical protein